MYLKAEMDDDEESEGDYAEQAAHHLHLGPAPHQQVRLAHHLHLMKIFTTATGQTSTQHLLRANTIARGQTSTRPSP